MSVRWNLWFVPFAMLAGLTLLGCSRAPQSARVTTPAAPVAPADEFVVGKGITYANLTVFPITSRTLRDNDRLLTLDEGLAAGTVEVRELAATNERSAPAGAAADPFGDPLPSTPPASDEPAIEVTLAEFGGNQVNRVLVHNKSDKPLYLMPGEIILGGDQDRTIGQELVLAPSDKPVEVEVFCVEHGRWGGKGQAETVAQLSALAASARAVTWSGDEAVDVDAAAVEVTLEEFTTQAAAADRGNFIVSAGALSKDARLAAQGEKDQGKVWDEVAIANAKSGVKIASNAFTAQYVEADAALRLEPYVENLIKTVIDEPQVVGVVVAIDGQVESFDVFESTPLFRKLWPKLLKSYAVDAANAAEQHDPKAPAITPCTQAVAAAFVKEAIAADVTDEEQSGDLAITKRDSEKVLLFTAHEPAQRPFVTSVIPLDGSSTGISGRSAAAGYGGGGLGGSVHGFGAAK